MATSDESAVLRGALDESRDGLLVLDEHGAILEANTAAAALLGAERRRLAGRPLADLVAPDDRPRLLSRLGTAGPASLELRLPNRDVACTLSLRALPGTEPRRVAVALSTERFEPFLLRFPHAVVALRRDLRVAFANDLARALLGPAAVRIGATFGELSPHELRAFAEELVEASEAPASTELRLADNRVLQVSGLAPTAEDPAVLFLEDVSERHRQELVLREFLRNAAHQLRTPVAGITAAIETLQAGAKERPADRDRFLAHIERHAERLRRVARGVLQLARARAGEAPPTDLVELRPLLDRLVEEAERDGVETVAVCPPGLAALAARELLHETLAALLDNALAHAPEGEIRISAEQAGESVLVTVSDHGPGIGPDLLDRVFEPFFQADPSGQGYGLGLAIAAQAVETMGGELDVASKIGAGTTFTVKLPAAAVAR